MQWPLSVQPAPSSRLTIGSNGRVQLPSFLPIQQPSSDDENALPSAQGSYPPFQYTGNIQQQPYYNQQQPNQVGVTSHSLQYLAHPNDPAQVAFYNNITRFNDLTQAQRAHELGQDKVYTKQDFQQLPPTNYKSLGKTQYFDGTAPNPSIKQRAENVVKAPVKGGQVIFHFLQHVL